MMLSSSFLLTTACVLVVFLLNALDRVEASSFNAMSYSLPNCEGSVVGTTSVSEGINAGSCMTLVAGSSAAPLQIDQFFPPTSSSAPTLAPTSRYAGWNFRCPNTGAGQVGDVQFYAACGDNTPAFDYEFGKEFPQNPCVNIYDDPNRGSFQIMCASRVPTRSPTTSRPSTTPSRSPTPPTSFDPSAAPTPVTSTPSVAPSKTPSEAPTTAIAPSSSPSELTYAPSAAPVTTTVTPSKTPTRRPTPRPSKSPVVAVVEHECRPQFNFPKRACMARILKCKRKRVMMKWSGAGCRGVNGQTTAGDGGCQCKGYCGFNCAKACNADVECAWSTALGQCTSKATGLPTGAMTQCT